MVKKGDKIKYKLHGNYKIRNSEILGICIKRPNAITIRVLEPLPKGATIEFISDNMPFFGEVMKQAFCEAEIFIPGGV